MGGFKERKGVCFASGLTEFISMKDARPFFSECPFVFVFFSLRLSFLKLSSSVLFFLLRLFIRSTTPPTNSHRALLCFSSLLLHAASPSFILFSLCA